nr:DNA cytosine methyltransferase [uncultured Carboxylicivirga sp.]
MRVLNLYSGLGGNRKLWKGADVTAVELNRYAASIYRQMYSRDKIIVGDAHEYLLRNHERFDFVWSSPPCQSHSKMVKATRHDIRKFPDMKLYEEIIWLQHFFKGKWVVENVKPYYKPLVEPTAVLGRHCFWSNFSIGNYEPPAMGNFIQAHEDDIKKWLGLEFSAERKRAEGFRLDQAIRNCVHPELGRHVYSEMKKAVSFGGMNGTSAKDRTAMKAKAIRLKQKQHETGTARANYQNSNF